MMRGSATTDHQLAYFTSRRSQSVFKYEPSTLKWEELPPCPYFNSGLIIIDGKLTAVGGCTCDFMLSVRTNKVFILQQGQWFEQYPPMNTERSEPAVVGTSDGIYIFVIGGCIDDNATTVEIFHVTNRRWYEVEYLPPPLYRPSATICGNQLYIIGETYTGYSCSLQALLPSDQPITSHNILSWTPLPQLPVSTSTAVTLSGQLVIVGGQRSESAIHQLIHGQWVEIGSLSTGRSGCLIVTLSPDKIMIVGGDERRLLGSVEECVVV